MGEVGDIMPDCCWPCCSCIIWCSEDENDLQELRYQHELKDMSVESGGLT